MKDPLKTAKFCSSPLPIIKLSASIKKQQQFPVQKLNKRFAPLKPEQKLEQIEN